MSIGDALIADRTRWTPPLLAFAVLFAGLAVLLCAPAVSPAKAKSAASSCSSAATHAKPHVRACAGRHGSARAHRKLKSRHSRGHHRIKKKSKRHHDTTGATRPAPKPASCEDGSRPHSEGEGDYSCADGSEPVCANGAEPTPTLSGTKLVCPLASAPGIDWSEAECEDGEAPERDASGSYVCEDGSRPSCPDGSQPTLSDDGSMLVCMTHGSGGPAPASPQGEEDDEGEADADRVRVAIAS
jgi:hypothetical protein